MITWEEVKPIFERVLVAIQQDRSKFTRGLPELNVLSLECAIGNHLLDDKPELFGITEREGHVVRVYVHEQAWQLWSFCEN